MSFLRKRNGTRKPVGQSTPIESTTQSTPINSRTQSDVAVNDITTQLKHLSDLLAPIYEEMTKHDHQISDITSKLDELNEELTSSRNPKKIQAKINELSAELERLNYYKSLLEDQAEPYLVERKKLLSRLQGNTSLFKKAIEFASKSVNDVSQYVANKYNNDGTIKYKNAHFASRVIDTIANHNLSIFDTYANIRQGEKVPKEHNNSIDENDNTLTIDCTAYDRPPQLKQELIDAVAQNNPPLVILVTSKIHAIIYIIHEGTKYTVGYGYNGVGDTAIKANQFANDVRGTTKSYAKKIKDPLAHMIEYLPGALYTADYLVPEDDDVANISWITFLDKNIIDQIQEMLNNATEIVYTIKNKYIEDQTVISLDQKYSEGIQIMKPLTMLNGYNCIVWAEKVLGIQGLCGIISNPSTCPSVTEDEWNDVIKNMHYPNKLIRIIQDIQCRLRPNFCTSIRRTLRLGGKKTRKNRKSNRKTRDNKTKK